MSSDDAADGPGSQGSSAVELVEGEDSASDAFQALGGDPRVTVLEALAGADDGRASFTALFEATEIETTAGFAYHLRQLDGRFVRRVPVGDDDEAYELTDAGRRVARAIAAGAFTASVDHEPVPVDDPCPLCGDGDGLHATVADNVTRISCDACERDVLALPFPPSGYATRDPAEVPAAVDAHHRRRIGAFADGVCPDCGGPATGRVAAFGDAGADDGDEYADDDDEYAEDGDDFDTHRVRAAFECDACGATLSCPVSLVLLEHPAVVAAYHDHGVDVRDRRLWTAGTDWRERVLSTDPWCVRATMEDPTTDGSDDEDDDDDDRDVLVAYVGGDLTVGAVARLDDENDVEAPTRITADASEEGSADGAQTDDGTPV